MVIMDVARGDVLARVDVCRRDGGTILKQVEGHVIILDWIAMTLSAAADGSHLCADAVEGYMFMCVYPT